MSWKLVVVEGRSRGAEFLLGLKAVLDVGSARTADVPLEDPEVAPVHVKVHGSNGEFQAFDVSGRGFLHNGKRTLKCRLRDGDVLQIGHNKVRYQDAQPVGTQTLEDATPAMGAAARCGLAAIKGNDAGKKFDLETKDVFILGRGVATDITVWDIRASRVHCRIDRDAQGHTITDLGASNGTFVNGEKVETVRLKAGDQVKIGSTVLEYLQR